MDDAIDLSAELEKVSATPAVVIGYYVSPEGTYYGGDKQYDCDIEVPQRPTRFHVWDFGLGYWVEDVAARDSFLGQTVKVRRTSLLTASDWTDTLSAKSRLGEDLYGRWQAYRQALRDISTQSGYPVDVLWPKPPVDAPD